MMCLPKIGSDPFARANAAKRERANEHTHYNMRREKQEGEGKSVHIWWL